MNINFNILITKSLPFIIILLISFTISRGVYIFLPKQSVEQNTSLVDTLEYKRYQFSNSFVQSEVKTTNLESEKKEYVLNDNIVLQSIFQIGDNDGFAIIMEKGKSFTISKNETFKGYKLTKIEPLFILFEKNGKIYKLFMEGYKEKPKQNNNIAKINKKPTIIKRNEDSFQLKKEDVLAYSNNLKRIWNDIGLRSEKRAGKTFGFKIYKLKKGSVFDQLGLKRNDILIEANNIKLDNYQNAFKLYNKINTTQLLKMKILRGNKEMEIEYDIQ